MNFIERKLDGISVLQRKSDGYVNATQLCKAANKRLDHYFENKQTKELIAEFLVCPSFV